MSTGVKNMKSLQTIIEDAGVQLLRKASIELSPDVMEALRNAYEGESSQLGKSQLEAILNNIKLAKELNKPICQDTGLMIFYVTIGTNFGDFSFIPDALTNATRRATADIPLRPNSVHPLTGHNPGDNTGTHVPIIHYNIAPGDYLEIKTLPKGGGAENMSALAMLSPAMGVKGIKKFVIERIIASGGKPCPPTIMGLGIGGKSDYVMELAKKALLRPINQRHPEKQIADLEVELLEMINSTGVGPMGLGGQYTCLAVNIEYAYRHPASFPVGINMQCWANRRATARIHKSGTVEYSW
jgi:fumarate hydratase subunit alpha